MPGGPMRLRAARAWIRRRLLGSIALIGLLLSNAALAAVLAEPDARAVRQVVEAQLEAFAADNAERAFSYASSDIQSQFGDARTFMEMVRRGYPMLIRPAAVSFFQPQVSIGSPETVTQILQVRDRDGRLWQATYLLQRQNGADWHIGGCVVAADRGAAST